MLVRLCVNCGSVSETEIVYCCVAVWKKKLMKIMCAEFQLQVMIQLQVVGEFFCRPFVVFCRFSFIVLGLGLKSN